MKIENSVHLIGGAVRLITQNFARTLLGECQFQWPLLSFQTQ